MIESLTQLQIKSIYTQQTSYGRKHFNDGSRAQSRIVIEIITLHHQLPLYCSNAIVIFGGAILRLGFSMDHKIMSIWNHFKLSDVIIPSYLLRLLLFTSLACCPKHFISLESNKPFQHFSSVVFFCCLVRDQLFRRTQSVSDTSAVCFILYTQLLFILFMTLRSGCFIRSDRSHSLIHVSHRLADTCNSKQSLLHVSVVHVYVSKELCD